MQSLPALKILFPEHFGDVDTPPTSGHPSPSFGVKRARPHDEPPSPSSPHSQPDSKVGDGSEHDGDDFEHDDIDGTTKPSSDSSGDRRHCCPHCGKRFNRPSSLKIHVNTHTGVKPFACPFPGCKRQFNVSSNMRRHFRGHTQTQSSNPYHHLHFLPSAGGIFPDGAVPMPLPPDPTSPRSLYKIHNHHPHIPQIPQRANLVPQLNISIPTKTLTTPNPGRYSYHDRAEPSSTSSVSPTSSYGYNNERETSSYPPTPPWTDEPEPDHYHRYPTYSFPPPLPPMRYTHGGSTSSPPARGYRESHPHSNSYINSTRSLWNVDGVKPI
ncbi:hypothetical protein BD410DRAFT_757160 [Rickenella mellea]|uniref:C2H2-type domain-containing protein n=1 Tax=Rickenella mellea TaxID=50990 RepID=A0A4Y7PGQ2_9AGAM|nr:hypothetical protein BD410DRAFT_757160 [Rickenella mellea]